MSSKRHSHQTGTTPTTEAQDSPEVAQFSVSGVAQFSVSLDTPGSGEGGFHLVADANQAASGADAMLLLTEWPQFAALDWAELAPL
jgi:UDP-glucose 6-dehydrogenase